MIKFIDKDKNLGFMQGRLSPMIDNMIQCFPLNTWKEELGLANENNWRLIEWTIDYYSFLENPIIKDSFSKAEFKELRVECITADFFMQNPFFLINDKSLKNKLILDFKKVVNSMVKLDIKYLMLPLVDNASLIKNNVEENYVIEALLEIFEEYRNDKIEFIFESDFDPDRLMKFIESFDSNKVGINYDSGNSAGLGYDCEKEISTYGKWIKNCHLKDKILGGTTVKFGSGNTNFHKVLNSLKNINYDGNFIIQGARSKKGQDLEYLNYYREYIINIANEL